MSITAIIFWILLALFVVSIGMKIWEYKSKRDEGWIVLIIWSLLAIFIGSIAHRIVINDTCSIGLGNSPIGSQMEMSMLTHVASEHVKTMDGYMITGVGTFYFLGNGKSGKNRKVETYYAYKHNGAAYFSNYQKYRGNAFNIIKNMGRLGRQCVMDDYQPACKKMISYFTYTPGWVPILPESKPKLFINTGKPFLLKGMTHASPSNFKEIR